MGIAKHPLPIPLSGFMQGAGRSTIKFRQIFKNRMNTCSSGRGSAEPPVPDYRLHRLDACDVDEHAQNLSLWEQHYDQLAPGRFTGSLQEFWTQEGQVFFETTSHAVHQRCQVWDEAIWFGMPLRHDGTRIGGREAPSASLLLQPGGRAFELLTPSDHRIFGVVLRREALLAYGAQIGIPLAEERFDQSCWLQADSASHTRALTILEQLFAALADHPGLALHEASRRNFGHSVLEAILPILSGEAAAEAAPAFERHRKLVAAIEAEARSHPDWVPGVPELCARFHISRRNLQYAFEDVLGVSPLSYLRSLRLNGARRSLRDPGSGFDNVSEAAAAWGFWHLGQFSQDYRKLFGERPSDTLRMARGPSH